MKSKSKTLCAASIFPTHVVLSFGLAVAGLAFQSAHAADQAWSTNPASASISGVNWTPGQIPGAASSTALSGDSLYFGTSAITALNNDTFGSTFAGLTFNAGASPFIIGGNPFTLSSGIANNSSSVQVVANPLTLTATQTVNTNTGTVGLTGFIGGTGFGLAKTGTGTLILNGGNFYTGTTAINAGVLSIVGNSGLGANAAPVTFDGGTLRTNMAGSITNTHPTTINAGGGTINVNSLGTGNLTLLFGTATTLLGAGPLVVTGNGSLGTSGLNSGVMVLNVANAASTFTGTLTMQDGGILEINNTTALNPAVAITLGNNGGVCINSAAGSVASNVIVNGTNSVLNFGNGVAGNVTGTVTLNNDLLVRMGDWYNWAAGRSGTISGVISGPGGITVGGLNSTLTVANTNNYLGVTLVTQNALTLATNTTSSIAGSSSVSLSNAFLNLNYTLGNINKVKDTASVTLRNNAFVNLTGNGTPNTTETIGAIEIAGGNNAVNVSTTSTAVTTLAASAINRSNLGTSLVIGSSLGQQVTSVGKISLITPPSGINLIGAGGSPAGTGTITNLGIIPWLAGATSGANTAARDFVTYDTVQLSLRPLVSGEYDAAGTIAGAAAGSNVKSTTTTETGLLSTTLNSLFLVPAAAQAITGAGAGNTLTISSGALASGLASGVIGTAAFNSTLSGFDAVAFGNGEAVVTVAQTLGGITINSPITVSGAGGLTKTGVGTLTLGVANTYTGPTTVNQGTLAVTAGVNNVFNATTGTPVVLANAGFLNVNASTQKITSLDIVGSAGTLSGVGGTVDLGGNVTFDATLNPNSAGIISVATLNLNGTRTFNIGDSAPLTGNDVTLSSLIADGSVVGSGLTKSGAGTLGVSGPSTYSGATVINGGVLAVTTLSAAGLPSNIGASGIAAANLEINGGTLRHTGTVTSTDRNYTFGDNGVTLDASGATNAALSLTGSATYVTPNQPRTFTLAGTSTGANSYGSNLVDNGSGALSLVKTGPGMWSITGANTYSGGTTINQGTLQVGIGGASGSIVGNVIANANAVIAFNRSDPSSFAGSITGFGGVTKSGAGALNLSGQSTFTGNFNIAGGVLNLSGTIGGNTNNGNFRVGTVASAAATLNILPGAVGLTRLNLFVGDAGTGTGGGAVYQSGGSLTLTQGAGIDNLRVGSNSTGYGYYNLSGGSVTSIRPAIGASLLDTVGVVEVTGGSFIATEQLHIASGSATSSGLLNVTGGSVVVGTDIRMLSLQAGTAGATQQAVVNVGGGGSAASVTTGNLGTVGINLAQTGAIVGELGVCNLLTNGTLNTGRVLGSQANAITHFNFNGGTLKATATNNITLFGDAILDAVNVYGAGGTIDNNGTAITINRALLVPAGFGVSATSITVPSGGSGYIGAPLVKFTGGTGSGATGYAVISGGVVSNIVVTSPGTGYTGGDTLTATFFGAAAVPATAVAGIAVAANNTTGGMTFQGSGTTTLSGANSYLGTTAVTGGTLAVNGTALADTGKLVINGGKVAPTGTEVVDTLYFGGVQQASGLWGSTSSAAPVSHQDNTRFSGTGVVSVTTGAAAGYASWAAINAGGQTADLDFDNDGIKNGTEYFFGATGSTFTANPALISGTVTWPKSLSFTGTYMVETSTDLINWTDVTGSAVDNGTSVTYTPTTVDPARFVRLKVNPT